ncbi:hypothetical protein FT663_00473 [Candidozyma haemuli var. vulneris]|uniref:Vta1 C-terminal domain-containing protein n=1 Tax=Candidozyma haemuli TaxID=45357 RepID=A0A2V1AU68_9ASCO|nr:hypothetical protein CXQ85_002262 [[Candida] haemuloni]KAF3993450.1 hypothetical protein FT662_00579 [[Candida] haemuloni var. vulneris]KAF3995420.1 hypothetical protein FT663_00473 [[Candida] haemuloni var. vulneris]PVH20471.1 hypothetical protein CXQ85_002262 [[Candida] haemuloni]
MSIKPDSVPASIKKDINVTPFIARASELQAVHPVVSYYCKVYVLEHILSNKLHTTDKEVETFTISLLEDTEKIKTSTEDEDLHKILTNRQLSLNVSFAFVFKLFLSSLEDISNYDGTNKIQLASKLRASINFMTSLKVFTGDGDDGLDFGETTGSKCTSKEEFTTFIKEKTKVLKFQLSKLIKDEIPLKGEDEDEELAKLQDEELEKAGESLPHESPSASDKPSTEPHDHEAETPDFPSAQPPALPSPPRNDEPDNPLNLPGAPKYDPESEPNADDEEVKLPGAPKFLPDDDLSHINKDSSIKVFPPGGKEEKEEEKTPAKPSASRSGSANPISHHKPITKENLKSILDTGEQITQVQKHAKFAISALNYEDIETAEKELLKGLEVLRLVKENS